MRSSLLLTSTGRREVGFRGDFSLPVLGCANYLPQPLQGAEVRSALRPPKDLTF